MEEEIDDIVSSLDEKDDEESEERKEEEQISYPRPSNESKSSTHTLFNFPSCLPKDECYDDCYDPLDLFEKY